MLNTGEVGLGVRQSTSASPPAIKSFPESDLIPIPKLALSGRGV